MSSLLSRMEQQFLLSHSRVIEGGSSELDMIGEADSNYIVPEIMPQPVQAQPQVTQWATSTPAVIQPTFVSTQRPQITYICDSMIDHVTEVEIDTEQPSAPSPR